MPIVHTRFVVYSRSRHRRHSMSTAIDLIPPLTNGPTAHYEDSARPGFPVSSSSGPMTSVRFAFWSDKTCVYDWHKNPQFHVAWLARHDSSLAF